MRASLAMVALTLTALALTLVPLPASAGGCDDTYGCTTTTSSDTRAETCSLSSGVADPGDTVGVVVTDVAPGSSFEVRFDGTRVGEGTADPEGDEAGVDVSTSFVVPANASEGMHVVTAVGIDFTVRCTFEGKDLEVGSSAIGGPLPRTDGPLPRTGAEIALWLAIALALLIVGRTLVESSRRRRRRARREAAGRRHPPRHTVTP
jgi:hypothetical protein